MKLGLHECHSLLTIAIRLVRVYQCIEHVYSMRLSLPIHCDSFT